MTVSNRRQFSRQTTETAVQVYLTAENSKKRKNNGEFIPVTICNQSDNGVYLEIDRALKPGSNICIKMVAPERRRSEDAYFMRDAQVVWCKKVDDEASRFGAGAKILRKVVQADVLTSRFR